jgi:hypothetical protein
MGSAPTACRSCAVRARRVSRWAATPVTAWMGRGVRRGLAGILSRQARHLRRRHLKPARLNRGDRSLGSFPRFSRHVAGPPRRCRTGDGAERSSRFSPGLAKRTCRTHSAQTARSVAGAHRPKRSGRTW